MLFGSPLPHMPRSPQDSSAAHLGLSPHQTAAKSGIFSPGAFQSLFQSPSGATLDDSPFQSLSRPPAKHSPVSAAAQYSAAQASRQASVGQAQAQRKEQQHSTAGAADTKDHIAGMLVPVSAPAVSMANEQVLTRKNRVLPQDMRATITGHRCHTVELQQWSFLCRCHMDCMIAPLRSACRHSLPWSAAHHQKGSVVSSLTPCQNRTTARRSTAAKVPPSHAVSRSHTATLVFILSLNCALPAHPCLNRLMVPMTATPLRKCH